MKHLIFEDDETLNSPTRSAKKSAPKKEANFKPTATLKAGVDWDGESVEATSEVYAEPIRDWDTLLTELGYDPDLYEVIEPVKVSTWDSQSEEGVKKLYSYKANIQVKKTVSYRDTDYKDIVNLIKKHKPLKSVNQGEGFFVVNFADWQAGKADGYGTEGFVKAILEDFDKIEARIDELIKSGRNIGTLVVALVGDMVENCDGNYASQTFTVQLNRRQQIRVVRRLLAEFFMRMARKFERVIALAVPGNHGENRKDGRAYTTPGDNDDVAVLEMVADILSANPEAYGHVEFLIPEDEVYVTVQLGKDIYGWFHGHITSGGSGNVQNKIKEWWKNQTFGGENMAHARVLVTGHYHHLSIVEHDDDRIHIQCPSMDGGSDWFKNLTGTESRPGTLTFVVDDSDGRAFRDLEIV